MRAQIAVDQLDRAQANALASVDDSSQPKLRTLVDEACGLLADARELAASIRDDEQEDE